MRYKFFEAGISPREFRKCRMRDIEEIMDIKRTIEERQARESEIQNLINRMGKW